MIDAQEYAAEHKLPRVVWQAHGFRLVQYLADEDERITLGLERREGWDYLGHERWATVCGDGSPADGWDYVARDWQHAFYELARCLFLPGGVELPVPLIVADEADTQEDDADLPYEGGRCS